VFAAAGYDSDARVARGPALVAEIGRDPLRLVAVVGIAWQALDDHPLEAPWDSSGPSRTRRRVFDVHAGQLEPVRVRERPLPVWPPVQR